MTTRASARHRAPVRPNTPLSSLASAVTDHVGTIGRGGVVIAMSSGLVASMGMPASAVGRQATSPEAASATAPIAVQPALAFQSSLIATQAGMQSSAAPLTAPVAAKVSFENRAFRAVPKVIRTQTPSHGIQTSTFTGGSVSAKGSSVLAVASRYIGVAYRYGGTSLAGGTAPQRCSTSTTSSASGCRARPTSRCWPASGSPAPRRDRATWSSWSPAVRRTTSRLRRWQPVLRRRPQRQVVQQA